MAGRAGVRAAELTVRNEHLRAHLDYGAARTAPVAAIWLSGRRPT